MDSQTENGLIQRLQGELKGRTLLLITHRPSLLALVSRILLIDKGKVVADGPRDEVLKQITQPPRPGPAAPGPGPRRPDVGSPYRGPGRPDTPARGVEPASVGGDRLHADLHRLGEPHQARPDHPGSGSGDRSSQLQTLSNLEGGVVEAILVKTGRGAGQPRPGAGAARPDRDRSQGLGSGKSAYFSLQAKTARLQAEIAGREPVYPAAPNAAVAAQIQIERALHASRMAEDSAAW